MGMETAQDFIDALKKMVAEMSLDLKKLDNDYIVELPGHVHIRYEGGNKTRGCLPHKATGFTSLREASAMAKITENQLGRGIAVRRHEALAVKIESFSSTMVSLALHSEKQKEKEEE